MAKELAAMARWVSETGQRMVVVFEGRDTAGKGGSIDMFARVLNPRQCRIVALPSPNERERTQWYFQRYVEHLPGRGRDRAVRPQLVQSRRRREGDGLLHARADRRPSCNAVPEFERQLVDDGILLFKYWLCCDQDGAGRALREPAVQSDEALEAVADRYQGARRITTITPRRARMMLAATHTDFAPWTLVDFNDQPLGRLTLLRDLLDRVPDTELPLADIPWPPLDRRAVERALCRAEADPEFKVPKKAKHDHHKHHEH